MFYFLFIMLFLSSVSQAENLSSPTKTIQVIGSSPVLSSDVVTARERAISNSLVSAISQVAGERLPENGLVMYFHELNNTFFKDTRTYVQNYRVLAEWESHNIYRVVVEITISVDALIQKLSDAGFIRIEQSLPKVLFLISEQSVEGDSPRFWWEQDNLNFTAHSESEMSSSMVEQGFTIIGHHGLGLPFELDYLRRKYSLTNEEALRIGGQSTSEVLIVGDAVVHKATNIMGSDKRTFKAVVSVRALRSDTGAQIAATQQTAVIVDTDEIRGGKDALIQAGKLAGDELGNQVAISWQTIAKKADQIVLELQGTSDLPSFVRFRKSLKEISDVQAIFISEMKPDEATIMVDYKGSAPHLAETLMLNTFDAFGINIYEIEENLLRIKLVKE